VFVSLFIRVAADHCALNFNPGVPLTVTPEPAAIVVCPAPVCSMCISVNVGKATLEFGGTVTVFAEALFISTKSKASVKANV